ncbi:glycerate kinase [soil metagenome]
MRELLLGAFDAALAAADARRSLAAWLPARPVGRVIVVGAGKAAAAMAVAVEQAWPDQAIEGLVVTRYGHGLPTRHIEVVEAGHPVPDAGGEAAARRILELVSNASPDDHVLVLVSGGGSSLLSLPVESVSMADLRAVTTGLLRSGADIKDMNIVRKHLSRIAGGHLARASAAPMTALCISDVAGDDLSAIASGPTVPDPSTYADALAILERFAVALPASVRAHLQAGLDGKVAETPKADDACFERVQTHLIATAAGMLDATAAYFTERGHEVIALGELEGEAGDVARDHAGRVAALIGSGDTGGKPVAIVSGGECTVTVKGNGRGGRCSEYLLHLGIALDELGFADRIGAIACDTDGIDGSEDNAGAFMLPDSVARARQQSIDARAFAAQNDAWGYFDALGELVVTGPTRTNVNDLRVIVLPRDHRP